MSHGWIKIHRQIQNHWLYTDKREFSYFEAWIDILLSVNHSDAKTMIQGVLYEVKRGESINSLDTWAKRWNWSKSRVRRFLKTLESDLMIKTKNETITTRLTVCNYDSYQDERNANKTQTKRRRNADETQTTPNNNENNVNNENNENNIPAWEDFLDYALQNKPLVSKTDLKLKYDAWAVNGWKKQTKDGKLVKILNWKSTLLNTLPYIANTPPQTVRRVVL